MSAALNTYLQNLGSIHEIMLSFTLSTESQNSTVKKLKINIVTFNVFLKQSIIIQMQHNHSLFNLLLKEILRTSSAVCPIHR